MTVPKAPTAPAKPVHLGELVRCLREAAGLTRNQLAKALGCSPATVRNVEKWRHLPTERTVQELLQHPAMARLPELAKEAGLVLGRGLGEPGERRP